MKNFNFNRYSYLLLWPFIKRDLLCSQLIMWMAKPQNLLFSFGGHRESVWFRFTQKIKGNSAAVLLCSNLKVRLLPFYSSSSTPRSGSSV